ncbi:MAG: hypothetical protein AB7I19_11395 [Planctomycetota bacterium]
MLSEPEAHRLLDDLCIKLGFCLPPADRSKLTQDPPSDVRAFTDAVFLAEGLDVELADRHLYRQVRGMVAAAFEGSC